MIALALALSYAGFACWCMAMDRHRRDARLASASSLAKRLLRSVGSLLIAAALWPCFGRWSVPIAITAWLGAISTAALPLVSALAYRPRLALLSLPPMLLMIGAAGAWGVM